jgi:replicative DNA helicase
MSNGNLDIFSVEFQMRVLQLMITEDIFLIKCTRWLKEEYFNDPMLAWLFKTMASLYKVYNKQPTLFEIESEAMKFEVKEQPKYFEMIKKVMGLPKIDTKYMLRELTAFVRKNKFIDMANKMGNLFNKDSKEDAYSYTQSAIDDILQINLEPISSDKFKNIQQYIDEETASVVNAIPTGVTLFDEALRGGLPKGTLSAVLSATNAGKSMFLINIAKHAVAAGKKVLYIAHEDPEGPTMIRLMSCLSKIPYNKILSQYLTTEEKATIAAIGHVMDEQFQVHFMYGSDVCIEDVVSWLRLKKKEFNFDLFIDDYGQFITTRHKTDSFYESESIVHKNLKQIALELKVAVLTCLQGTRDAQKVAAKGLDYLRASDISHCFDIARRADILITLNRSDEQEKKGEMILFLEKVRHGEKNIAVLCMTDFARCMTHEPGKMQLYNSAQLMNDAVAMNGGLKKAGR